MFSMDFEILQENLLKACSIATRFTSTRSEIPILSNLLLKAHQNNFEILSTNLESSIKILTGAKINEEGAVCVSAKTFLEYLTSIGPQKFNLKKEGQKLQINGEQTKAAFVTMKTEDFPRFPQIKKEMLVSLEKNALKKLIQQTTFAAASDEGRPVLTGVLIKAEQSKVSFVATDGFRLSESLYFLPEAVSEAGFQLIVRASALNELERLLNDASNEKVDFFLTEEGNQMAFNLGGFSLITRLLEAEYPAYEKVIPQEFKLRVLVDTQNLQKAVKVASIFAGSDGQTIKLKFSQVQSEIVLTGESAGLGEGETRVPAEIEGEEISMAFNARFLLEGLSSIKASQVQIQVKAGVAPTLFTSPEEPNYKHVIMPIRLEQEQPQNNQDN